MQPEVQTSISSTSSLGQIAVSVTEALLQNYPFLKSLEKPLLSKLVDPRRVVNVPRGVKVFGEADVCENYLLLLEGSVCVHKITENGREIVLYRVEPGETCILTTACLLSGEEYPAEAITETPVRALTIPRKLFNEALGESSQFRNFVHSVYGKRVTGLILLIEEVAFGHMDARLAQCLLRRSKGAAAVYETHQEIADELGTLREVVSRLLKDLERKQIVALGRGQIEIRNEKALIELSKK